MPGSKLHCESNDGFLNGEQKQDSMYLHQAWSPYEQKKKTDSHRNRQTSKQTDRQRYK